MVTVTEEPDQITVKQSRFLSTGDVKAEEDSTIWWVPLMLTEKSYTASAKKISALHSKSDIIRGLDTSFYKLNSGQNGFYRVNYPASRLEKLGAARAQFSVADRVGLISDAAAMAFAGLGTSAGLLNFLSKSKGEDSYLVWAEILEQLGKMKSVFAEQAPEVAAGLKKFTLGLISPSVEKIGWESQPGEDYLTGRLRALLLSSAGTNGDKA